MINPVLNDYILSLIAQGTPFIGTATGTNAYTITAAQITAYTEGKHILVRFTNGNTGAVTLNINGYGAKSIVRNANIALLSGDIAANSIHELVYDGTNFQLISQGAKLTAAQMQTPLAGFSVGSNTAVTNTDPFLTAIGKLQGQVNARPISAIKSRQSGTFNTTTNASYITIYYSSIIPSNTILLVFGSVMAIPPTYPFPLTMGTATGTPQMIGVTSAYIYPSLTSTTNIVSGQWYLFEFY